MKVISVFLIILTSGCVSGPRVINTHGVPTDKLAQIYVHDIGWIPTGDEVHALFLRVDDQNGNKVVEDTYWNPLPDRLVIEPGLYYFVVKCTTSKGMGYKLYNFHRLKFTLEPGKEYILYCLRRTEAGFLGLDKTAGIMAYISEVSKFEKEKNQNIKKLNQQHSTESAK